MDTAEIAFRTGGGPWRRCWLLAALLLFAACAGAPKPTLQERLATMSDTELVAYYQGVDARLRAVGEGVRREMADSDAGQHATTFQQPYFFGGDGQRLLRQRRLAERELVRRKIPPVRWATPPY
jgi:hypothetical protein